MPAQAATIPLPAFRTEGLTKTYGEGEAAVHALRGVELCVPEGELVVLLGPSGSGKSTLLNILGGLDRASSGSARFRDSETHHPLRPRPDPLPARPCRFSSSSSTTSCPR